MPKKKTAKTSSKKSFGEKVRGLMGLNSKVINKRQRMLDEVAEYPMSGGDKTEEVKKRKKYIKGAKFE